MGCVARHKNLRLRVEYNWRLTQFSNLLEALEAAPGERAFVTAWVDEEEQETVTFAEFRRRARVQAGIFRRCGVGTDDRVIIVMPQGVAGMTVFVGAMLLGAAPAFLAYPSFKVEASKYSSGLAGVTANLKAKVVVLDEEFPEEMLGHVSRVDGTTVLRLVAGASATAEIEEPARIGGESVAFIQHSAGTTGLQKGVALTHAAVLRQLEHLAQALRLDGAKDRIYSWLPLYHDMGLIACFMLPMVSHISIIMQSPLDWVMRPETMLQLINDHKCTLAWMPNFAFQFVARRTPAERRKRYNITSLRALINCSEPVRGTSMAEFQRAFGMHGSVLQSSYAMAENVFAVTQTVIDGRSVPSYVWADAHQFRSSHRVAPVREGTAKAMQFMSSGRLLPNHQIRVVSDSGAILEEGGVGEILLTSDCLFEGYYNRPDLTAQAFVDGWYRTGDLGFVMNNELYVVGRKKDLLIVGGENFYPQDIEELVAAHPAVHDGRAVAIGLHNPEIGTEEIVVVAEVELDEFLASTGRIENEIRTRVVSGMGVAVRRIILKPPKWIVKSTAGKPARSATREKLLGEHPELNGEG
jgi:fatty-acyl-CoA synthase